MDSDTCGMLSGDCLRTSGLGFGLRGRVGGSQSRLRERGRGAEGSSTRSTRPVQSCPMTELRAGEERGNGGVGGTEAVRAGDVWVRLGEER